MKKINYILPIIMMFLTINVKAVNQCTSDEMNRLRSLANNVQFKTEYEIIDGTEDEESGDIFAQYKIKVINMSDELRISYRDIGNSDFTDVSVSELDDISFYGGTNLEFKIYAYTNNLCIDELLKTEKLNLPLYNTFYRDNKDKCKKYPEFKYCKEFIEDNKTEDEINKEFEKYINGDDNEFKEVQNGYLRIVIILVVFVVIVGVIVAAKFKFFNKKRKQEDL